MNKLTFLFLAFAVGVISCSSVSDKGSQDTVVWNSNGKMMKEGSRKMSSRDVNIGKHVTKLLTTTAADIEFVQGSPSLKITGPENLIYNFIIDESGNTLTLRSSLDDGNVNFSNVKIKISFPNLSELSLLGSGNFTAETIDSEFLSISVRGSGDFLVNQIHSSSLKFFGQGSGDIKIGKTQTSNMQVLVQGSGDFTVDAVESVLLGTNAQGSGDIIINQMECTQLDAVGQGSGDTKLKNIELNSLRVIMQGSGDISLSGSATSATLTVQGSGDINARKLKCNRVSKTTQGTGEIYL